RASTQELERSDRQHADAPERLQCRLGADRRAEVPSLHPAELSAECDRLLLHAPARPERGEVVDARKIGGPVRLSLLVRRAEGILRARRSDTCAGEEDLSLYEQSFLGEVGGECRDDQAAPRGTGPR